MKKIILTLGAFGMLVAVNAQQSTKDSVVMGNDYVDEVYYNFEDGAKTNVVADDWHMAFTTDVMSAAILSNPINTTVKVWPNGDESDFNTVIDTAGFSSWDALKNDPASYEVGAFNQNVAGTYDYGWGSYNTSTHKVVGDSIYLVQVGDTELYKVYIEELNGGVTTVHYAAYDATTPTIVDVDGSQYNSKLFVFFNLSNGSILDNEAQDWDLWVRKYHDQYGTYGVLAVTGILTHPRWRVAEVQVGVGNQMTATDFSSASFSYDKNVIGDNYKSIDYVTSTWFVTDSSVYYLQDTTTGDVWKWYPESFGGSANGTTVFYKQQIQFASITSEISQFLDVYPNPVQHQMTLVFDSKNNSYNVAVYNQMGQQVYFQQITAANKGIEKQTIDMSTLEKGMYFLKVYQNGHVITKKISKL